MRNRRLAGQFEGEKSHASRLSWTGVVPRHIARCERVTQAEYMTSEEYAAAYERSFDTAVRFFLSRRVSRDDAVECVQAAWAKGWERRDQLREPSLVLPWIISIARNLRNSVLRRELRLTISPERLVGGTRHELTGIIAKELLERSRPADRTILEAYYIEGHTMEEIAQAVRISEGGVRLRILRARKRARGSARIGVKVDPKS
jgi:RNA polymerase sigma factor (sigma-70 family)